MAPGLGENFIPNLVHHTFRVRSITEVQKRFVAAHCLHLGRPGEQNAVQLLGDLWREREGMGDASSQSHERMVDEHSQEKEQKAPPNMTHDPLPPMVHMLHPLEAKT